MKIKNEKQLKKAIQEKQDEYDLCLSEIEGAQSKIKDCLECVYNSENELSVIDNDDNSVQVNDSSDAIKAAGLKSSRRNELSDIISFNQKCIETLGRSQSNLSMSIVVFKQSLLSAREEFCKSHEDALKNTPEWKAALEKIDAVKAMWYEAFNCSIYAENIIDDLGFNEPPSDIARENARAELLIK